MDNDFRYNRVFLFSFKSRDIGDNRVFLIRRFSFKCFKSFQCSKGFKYDGWGASNVSKASNAFNASKASNMKDGFEPFEEVDQTEERVLFRNLLKRCQQVGGDSNVDKGPMDVRIPCRMVGRQVETREMERTHSNLSRTSGGKEASRKLVV